MQIFRNPSKNSWVLPVSVLSVLLGFMMTVAWITKDSRNERIASLSPELQSRIRSGSLDLSNEYQRLNQEYQKITAEMAQMRQEKTKLENAIADQGDKGELLNDALQKMKIQAGLTEVEGPGIVVTLRDSRLPESDTMAVDNLIIHDADVLRIVNEIWAAGAAAVAVNGHRVVGGTSFRCVGNVILVDNVPIAPPVQIQAIGSPSTLLGALEIPLGVLSQIKSTDPSMVSVQKKAKIRLKPYSGPSKAETLMVPVDEN